MTGISRQISFVNFSTNLPEGPGRSRLLEIWITSFQVSGVLLRQ